MQGKRRDVPVSRGWLGISIDSARDIGSAWGIGLGTLAFLVALLGAGIWPKTVLGGDFFVYSVYQELNLGNPGETPSKDYYVNMGSSDGLRDGSILEVSRRISTYDLLSEKLYKDLQFPIAHLRVIHVEGNASIARLDKLMPADKVPALSNRAVMVGDVVKISQH